MDIASSLLWGLRRYGWFVTLVTVALAVAVPAAVAGTPERYDAAAQVGPSESLRLANLDALPKVGTSVFANGAVANAVRATGDVPPDEDIIPGYVELGVAQDNIIFTVIGHGNNPQDAADLANIAATAYVQELNTYAASVGTFALQRSASPPRAPLPKLSRPLAITAGAGVGLLLGLAAVALWLGWRRPVVDVTTAELTTGSPVLGRLRIAHGGRISAGLPQLCRRLIVANVEALLLVGSRETRQDRLTTAAQLSGMAVSVGAGLRVVGDPTEFELAHGNTSTMTALVAHEGVPLRELRRQAEQLLAAGSSGVILLNRSGLLSALRGAARAGGADGNRTVATTPDGRTSVSLEDRDG